MEEDRKEDDQQEEKYDPEWAALLLELDTFVLSPQDSGTTTTTSTTTTITTTSTSSSLPGSTSTPTLPRSGTTTSTASSSNKGMTSSASSTSSWKPTSRSTFSQTKPPGVILRPLPTARLSTHAPPYSARHSRQEIIQTVNLDVVLRGFGWLQPVFGDPKKSTLTNAIKHRDDIVAWASVQQKAITPEEGRKLACHYWSRVLWDSSPPPLPVDAATQSKYLAQLDMVIRRIATAALESKAEGAVTDAHRRLYTWRRDSLVLKASASDFAGFIEKFVKPELEALQADIAATDFSQPQVSLFKKKAMPAFTQACEAVLHRVVMNLIATLDQQQFTQDCTFDQLTDLSERTRVRVYMVKLFEFMQHGIDEALLMPLLKQCIQSIESALPSPGTAAIRKRVALMCLQEICLRGTSIFKLNFDSGLFLPRHQVLHSYVCNWCFMTILEMAGLLALEEDAEAANLLQTKFPPPPKKKKKGFLGGLSSLTKSSKEDKDDLDPPIAETIQTISRRLVELYEKWVQLALKK